jgi:hypothetical protein
MVAFQAVAVTTALAEVITIDFDDIVAPIPIGDAYADQGVRFWLGNDDFCDSTGIFMSAGEPQSAWTYPCCAVSGSNILVPAPAANHDIIVEFFDICGQRVMTSMVAVTNDAQADPSISISAYDDSGGLIATDIAIEPGAVAQVVAANIWTAKICAVSGAGSLGVDNFMFERTVLGDLNDDGLVDGADLGLLLAAWGQPSADLNCDGTTDGADLGLLLAEWTV